MFQDKYIFAQLVSFLDRNKFNYIVRKYDGDRYVKHFTWWNQLLALMFGQLSARESLRDLIIALDAHHSKCYHLGMGKNVSKSSLARANTDRAYNFFKMLFEIHQIKAYFVIRAKKKLNFKISKNIQGLMSQICLIFKSPQF